MLLNPQQQASMDAVLTLLQETNALVAKAADEVRAQVKDQGIQNLVPILLNSVNSETVAKAVARAAGMRLYPYGEIPRGPGELRAPDVRAVPKSRGDDWLLTEDGILYLVNPLDSRNLTGLVSKLREKGLPPRGGIGVVSRGNVQQAGGTEIASATPAVSVGTVNIDGRINSWLDLAIKSNSSDIHFEPNEKDIAVRMRRDGDLQQVDKIGDYRAYMEIANRLMDRSGGRPGAYNDGHDGQENYTFASRMIKLRLAMLPVVVPGQTDPVPHFVIRLLGNRIEHLELKDLGLIDMELNPQIRKLRALADRSHGVLLVTGPTGSGKTTTLTSILRELTKNYPSDKFYTVEDPVEITLHRVSHIQVNEKAGLTFAKALIKLLRKDPDVIVVGEIRDQEVANIALTASVTGHLVMSTLHTNGAVETITRLLDMGCDRFIVSDTLAGATAQRLVKKLCPRCRIPARWHELVSGTHSVFKSGSAYWERMKHLYASAPMYYETLDYYPKRDATVYIQKLEGCEACNKQGYLGRTLVSEILEITPELAELINGGAPTSQIRKRAIEGGFKHMWQHGMYLVAGGLSSFDLVAGAVQALEQSNMGPPVALGPKGMPSAMPPKPVIAAPQPLPVPSTSPGASVARLAAPPVPPLGPRLVAHAAPPSIVPPRPVVAGRPV